MATVTEKAGKYLAEGRVKAQHVSADAALFHVQGSASGDPYHVRFSGISGWKCDCPARIDECAHVKAVLLVTDLRLGWSIEAGAEEKHSLGFVRDPDIDELLSGL